MSQHQSGATSSALGGGSVSPSAATGRKRAASGAEDPLGQDGRPQRAKRKKYVGNACTQCHRRHIKCNGQQPCERCSKMNLGCEYAMAGAADFRETDEYQQMQATISELQETTNKLQAQLTNLTEAQLRVASNFPFGRNPISNPTPRNTAAQNTSIPHSIQPQPAVHQDTFEHNQFQGPTSFQYNFNRAKSTLEVMGMVNKARENTSDGRMSPDMNAVNAAALRDSRASSSDQQRPSTASNWPRRSMHPDKDPLWALTKEEAVQLINVWQDEMGEMYPVLDFDNLTSYTKRLYSFIEPAARSGLFNATRPGNDGFMDENALILKAVFAISLTLRGGGVSDLGFRMHRNVRSVTDEIIHRPIEHSRVTLITLTAMYHFHRDDEGLAWRVLGLAARMLMELGFHRRSTYETFKNPRERHHAINLFWSVYVLDRRWSFGTGRSFALHDGDIDSGLPKPEPETYYLSSMVDYAQLSSKVWRTVANVDASGDFIDEEAMKYFDEEVLKWHRNLPPPLAYDPEQDSSGPSSPGDPENGDSGLSQHRRRLVQYLRRNQMRILIYRPILHTATSIANYPHLASTVVEVAQDSIRTITMTDRTTRVYKKQPMMFNYFLVSALAALFLAVSHAPADFSEQCKDEFYQAVELVRGLSAESVVGKRLWQTVRELKELGPKLGLISRNTAVDQPDESRRSRQRKRSAVLNQVPQSQDGERISTRGPGRAGLPQDSNQPREADHREPHERDNTGRSDGSERIASPVHSRRGEQTTSTPVDPGSARSMTAVPSPAIPVTDGSSNFAIEDAALAMAGLASGQRMDAMASLMSPANMNSATTPNATSGFTTGSPFVFNANDNLPVNPSPNLEPSSNLTPGLTPNAVPADSVDLNALFEQFQQQLDQDPFQASQPAPEQPAPPQPPPLQRAQSQPRAPQRDLAPPPVRSNGVANDLASLFNAAGGSYSLGGMLTIGDSGDHVYEGGSTVDMGQDELAKILGPLFWSGAS